MSMSFFELSSLYTKRWDFIYCLSVTPWAPHFTNIVSVCPSVRPRLGFCHLLGAGALFTPSEAGAMC